MSDLGMMADLVSLDWRGVRIEVKEPGTMKQNVAGHYGFISCQISLNKLIIEYWFATLITLLHKYGHHRDRRMFVGILILCVLLIIAWVSALLWRAALLNNWLIVVSVTGAVSVYLLKRLYIEPKADRHAAEHVPSILVFLSDLEFIDIIESLDTSDGRHPRMLHDLHKNMRVYNPELLVS